MDEKIPEIVKYTFIVVLATLGWYKELVMDILVVFDVSFLYNQEASGWDFKSQMVIVLGVTTFLSQTIIGLRVLVYGPHKVLGPELSKLPRLPTYILFLLLSPIAPAILLYITTRRSRNIRIEEKKLENIFK